MKGLFRIYFIQVVSLFACIFLTVSCTPDNYSYFPKQRTITKKNSICDSVYLVLPYSSFKTIKSKDGFDWVEDTVISQFIKNSSLEYLSMNCNGLKTTYLQMNNGDYDSLKLEFERMIKYFYLHKSKKYSMKLTSFKKGYGLILGTEFNLTDYYIWRDSCHSGKGGTYCPPNGVSFYYLCLLDFKTGEVLYYKYHYRYMIGGYNEYNQCTDENGLNKWLFKNVGTVMKGLLINNLCSEAK